MKKKKLQLKKRTIRKLSTTATGKVHAGKPPRLPSYTLCSLCCLNP